MSGSKEALSQYELEQNYRRLNKGLTQNMKQNEEASEQVLCGVGLKEFYQKLNGDLAREVNFVALGFWIVSYVLASSDKISGIDVELYSGYTYRNYLQWNAYITFGSSLIFLIYNISLSNLLNSETEHQNPPIDQNNSFKKTLFRYLKKPYEIFMSLGVLLTFVVKIVWVVNGLYMLILVDFSSTSSLVLAFSLIQLKIFFTYGLFLLLKFLTQTETKNQQAQKQQIKAAPIQDKKPNEQISPTLSKQQKSTGQSSSSDNNQNLKYLINKLKDSQTQFLFVLQKKALLFYSNFKDFDYLVNTFINLVVYSFGSIFLIAKGLSINPKTVQNSLFDIWMLSDAILMQTFFTLFVLALNRIKSKNQQLAIWKLAAKGLIYVELTWFNQHQIFKYSLIFTLIAKIISTFFGLALFLQGFDLESTKTILLIFMGIYFTKSIFLIFEGTVVFLNGKRSLQKLNEQRKQQAMFLQKQKKNQ